MSEHGTSVDIDVDAELDGGDGKVMSPYKNNDSIASNPGCYGEGNTGKAVCVRFFDTAGSQTPWHVVDRVSDSLVLRQVGPVPEGVEESSFHCTQHL